MQHIQNFNFGCEIFLPKEKSCKDKGIHVHSQQKCLSRVKTEFLFYLFHKVNI